jgi:dipeptidyl aminopeptidase/acylaminoacyl peptidase
MVVTNRGPRDPGSFWLVKDGRLAKLGSRNPLLNPEQLSDVEYIRYKARDGRIIPAYVTKPKGKGPFPLIVLPHGGPQVNEIITYDEWGQLLANAGYMVLQPQYRMSVGWGQDHFDAAYGEHGGKMQDDKDDGALYLVEQGLVDPNRMAMFGWSYGGYAALVAASRDPNIYQCVIAGAAVADAEKQYLGRRNPDLKALDEWSRRRGTIGINPINEIDKVNIPVLMVHGEDDRRVLYYHLKDYQKKFEAAGKTGEFVTLEGADHFYNTLMFNHQQQFYTKMLDYLANDCGPGGL